MLLLDKLLLGLVLLNGIQCLGLILFLQSLSSKLGKNKRFFFGSFSDLAFIKKEIKTDSKYSKYINIINYTEIVIVIELILIISLIVNLIF